MLPVGVTKIKTWSDQYQTHPESTPADADLSQFKYIGLHSKNYILAISMDIDIKHWEPEQCDLPMPNWVTKNKASGHSHAVWFFEGIVDKNNEKQSAYLATISSAMARKISTSGNATVRNNNATQNPYHSFWQTRVIHASRYSLGYLADCVDVGGQERDFSCSSFRQVGRNNALFYDTIRVAQKNDFSPSQIEHYATTHNAIIGSEFKDGPLPQAEVRSIIKSVCRYAERGYPLWQRIKAAAAAKRKRCATSGVAARAKALGISKSTFYAKRLHTMTGAVKHALTIQSDTSTGLEAHGMDCDWSGEAGIARLFSCPRDLVRGSLSPPLELVQT